MLPKGFVAPSGSYPVNTTKQPNAEGKHESSSPAWPGLVGRGATLEQAREDFLRQTREFVDAQDAASKPKVPEAPNLQLGDPVVEERVVVEKKPRG